MEEEMLQGGMKDQVAGNITRKKVTIGEEDIRDRVLPGRISSRHENMAEGMMAPLLAEEVLVLVLVLEMVVEPEGARGSPVRINGSSVGPSQHAGSGAWKEM